MTQQTTRKIARQATSYMTVRSGPKISPDDPLLQFAAVPHVAPRRNSITPSRQREFIAHLAATGIVSEAARHIGASMEALYKLRQKAGGEEFSAAWDAAVDRGVERLEAGALARAIRGEERMVVSGGKHMGSEVRYNESLVMFFLRNRRADRYGADIKAGHPIYERIRAEVLAEAALRDEREEEEVLAALDAKLEAMRIHEMKRRGLPLQDGPDYPDDPADPAADGAGGGD